MNREMWSKTDVWGVCSHTYVEIQILYSSKRYSMIRQYMS